MFRTLQSPTNVQVELTDRCNHCCRHCYNFFRHEDVPLHTLDEEHIDMLLDELERWKVVRCIVTGGEPLVYPDLTLRLIAGARDRGITTALNTNLSLFTRKIGEELLALGNVSMMTSLIADTPELFNWVSQSRSFHKVCENIQLAVDMGFRVAANMVIANWNVDRIWQTGCLAGSLGVGCFGATRSCSPCPIAIQFSKEHVLSVTEARESLRVLMKLKEEWGYVVDVFEHYPWCLMQDIVKYEHMARRRCTAGVTSAVIGASGQLRPCGHSDEEYGNIFEIGLNQAWLKMGKWRERAFLDPRCQDCPYLKMCGGGCPTERLKLGADPHVTTPDDVIAVPDQRVDLPSIDGQALQFRTETLFREEEFGGTVITHERGALLLGEQTYTLALQLSLRRWFTVDTLVTEFDVKREEAETFMGYLLYKQAVQTTDGRR